MDEVAGLLAPVSPILPGHSIYRKDGDIMQSMGMLRTAHVHARTKESASPGDVGRCVVRVGGEGGGGRGFARGLFARSICRECNVGDENSRSTRY